eukprot:4564898-Lingulodinium_polyedra.AAC.1
MRFNTTQRPVNVIILGAFRALSMYARRAVRSGSSTRPFPTPPRRPIVAPFAIGWNAKHGTPPPPRAARA